MARLTWVFAVWELRFSWLAITSLLNPAATKITYQAVRRRRRNGSVSASVA